MSLLATPDVGTIDQSDQQMLAPHTGDETETQRGKEHAQGDTGSKALEPEHHLRLVTPTSRLLGRYLPQIGWPVCWALTQIWVLHSTVTILHGRGSSRTESAIWSGEDQLSNRKIPVSHILRHFPTLLTRSRPNI